MQVSLVTNTLFPNPAASGRPEKTHHYPARHRRPAKFAMAPFAGAIGCGLAFFFTYLVFVQTLSGQRVENTALLAANTTDTAADSIAGVLRDVDFVPLLGVTAVLLPILALLRRRYALAGGALLTLLGSLAVAQFLKLAVLPRPALGEASGAPDHNSFPSGHVTAAMAVLLGLMLVLPRRVRPWIAVPGALAVAWVAASTVILGWHRLSDTLGAIFLVAGLCCVALTLRGGRPASLGRGIAALVLPLLVAVGAYVATSVGAEGAGVLVMAVVLAGLSGLIVVAGMTWLMASERVTG